MANVQRNSHGMFLSACERLFVLYTSLIRLFVVLLCSSDPTRRPHTLFGALSFLFMFLRVITCRYGNEI